MAPVSMETKRFDGRRLRDLDTLPQFQLAVTLPGGEEGPAFLKLCSVPIVARLAIAAARAGARRICLLADGPAADRARAILERERRIDGVELVTGPPPADMPVIEATADVALSSTVIELLARAERPSCVPGAPTVRTAGEGDRREPLWEREPPMPGYVIPIRDRRDLPAAKRIVLAHARSSKPRGPVRRYLNELMTRPLSVVLVDTPVTPNQLTAITMVLVLASTWMLATGELGWIALGGFLLYFSSVVDCLDGELARATFRESPRGAWFDVLVDHVGYPLTLLGLFMGYDRYAQAAGVPWAPYTAPVGYTLLVLASVLVAGMFLYMHVRKAGIAMTWMVESFRSGGAKGNVVFRALDSLTALGRRSAMMLVIAVCTGLAWLGLPATYHALIFVVVLFIPLVILYVLLGVMHARRSKPATQAPG